MFTHCFGPPPSLSDLIFPMAQSATVIAVVVFGLMLAFGDLGPRLERVVMFLLAVSLMAGAVLIVASLSPHLILLGAGRRLIYVAVLAVVGACVLLLLIRPVGNAPEAKDDEADDV